MKQPLAAPAFKLMADNRYTIPSLGRAIDVLSALARKQQAMTLAELTRHTEIPKSTLYRILATLQEQRCVFMDEGSKRYRLGAKLWELGSAFIEQSDLNSAAVPYMKRLAEACGESVFLGIMDEGEVLYIRRIESPKSVLAVRKLGQRAPAYCTATGEAMIAFASEDERARHLGQQPLTEHTSKTETRREQIEERLAEVRRRGVARVDGEYNEQLLCVSAPVMDAAGRPRASLTVAMLSEQATGERVRRAEDMVREAAQGLSSELGFAGRLGSQHTGRISPWEANGRL